MLIDADGCCWMRYQVLLIEDAALGSEEEGNLQDEVAEGGSVRERPAVGGVRGGGHALGGGGGGRSGLDKEASSSVHHAPPQKKAQCYTLNLAGVGVSIIDGTPEELVYVSVLGIKGKSVHSGQANARVLPV
jgi:hypothetical protein